MIRGLNTSKPKQLEAQRFFLKHWHNDFLGWFGLAPDLCQSLSDQMITNQDMFALNWDIKSRWNSATNFRQAQRFDLLGGETAEDFLDRRLDRLNWIRSADGNNSCLKCILQLPSPRNCQTWNPGIRHLQCEATEYVSGSLTLTAAESVEDAAGSEPSQAQGLQTLGWEVSGSEPFKNVQRATSL